MQQIGLKALAAFSAALVVAATAAGAQEYPSKQISITMPYAAGGPGDAITRLVAQGMSEALKQQVIVENIGGAGGTIGSARVAAATPDGYSLLLMHIGHATNVSLYPKLKYDAIKDFEPIGLVGDVPMLIVGRKSFPADDFKSFVAYIKANKDSLTYAHAGIGSASQLCGMLLFSAIGVETRQVPYRGTGPAMNDLLGGQVDFLCDQTVNTVPNAQAGTIKGFAVTTPKRLATVPNLPTAQEAGLKGFDLSIWYALYAPKGTPKSALDKLVPALQASLANPTVKSKLEGIGVVVASKERATPAALSAHLKAEIAKWGPIIKKAGVIGQ
jgi:tripartite-type tricarboxylate transporter receptor subunit TctC